MRYFWQFRWLHYELQIPLFWHFNSNCEGIRYSFWNHMRGLCITFETIGGLCTKILNHRRVKCNLPKKFIETHDWLGVRCGECPLRLWFYWQMEKTWTVGYFVNQKSDLCFSWSWGALNHVRRKYATYSKMW